MLHNSFQLHMVYPFLEFPSSSILPNKLTHYRPKVILRLITQNQVIRIQEAKYSPLSLLLQESDSLPSYPHFHLLHQCVYMYIEESRGYDAPLFHPNIYPKLLTLTPFYSDTIKLLTYPQFRSTIYHPLHTFSTLATKLHY